jgi:hypothetical protein
VTVWDVIVGLGLLVLGFYAGKLERTPRGAFKCPGCHHDKAFHNETRCVLLYKQGLGCACQTGRGELEELEFRLRRSGSS